MLKLHAKSFGTAAVLCLEGQIINGETEILQNIVDSLPRRKALILNLGEVSIVDAHGLGVLLKLREQALQRGMRFELMNVSRPLSMVLEITHLDSVFPITPAAEFFPRTVAA
jgi:anti-anti-sigma factor